MIFFRYVEEPTKQEIHCPVNLCMCTLRFAVAVDIQLKSILVMNFRRDRATPD